MDTAQQRIEELAKEFIGRLQEIARDEVLRALGGEAAPRSLASRSASRRAKINRTGGKRDSSEIDRLGNRFLAFVSKHPGMRIEQINAELGTSTKNVALPIRKLIATKAIKTTGTKRSTKYFAAGDSTVSKSRRATKTRRSKR